MIDYPSSLPHPQKSGLTYSPVNNIERTNFASGRSRQRTSFLSVPETAPVTWVLTDGEANLFRYWALRVATHEWFNIALRSSMGLQSVQARFTQTYSGPTRWGNKHWSFTATLEIKEINLIPDEWYEYAPLFVQYASIIDMAINREWPNG